MKFTKEASKNELPFLDILIIKESRKIITDLFYKNINTNTNILYLIFVYYF